MRRSLFISAVLATLAAPAAAGEGVELSIRSKSMAASVTSAAPAKNAEAPFRAARDPLPDFFAPQEGPRKALKSACEANGSSLCYDASDRKLVYRPARKYMPQVDGLRAESVSLRRNRIVLKYSF
jgi:hypothetical protein